MAIKCAEKLLEQIKASKTAEGLLCIDAVSIHALFIVLYVLLWAVKRITLKWSLILAFSLVTSECSSERTIKIGLYLP